MVFSQSILISSINKTAHHKSDWVSDFCLITSEHFFGYIMTKTSYILMRWWWRALCFRSTRWVGFLLKQFSTERHVTLLGYIILFWDNQSLLLFLNAACLVKKQQIPIFTWPGLVSDRIYRTWGKHANH